jgi:YfiH family protein
LTLKPLISPKLQPFIHGFFSREGGSSSGIFKGLNCGFGSTDSSDSVKKNRQLICDTLSINCKNLVSLYQIHSNKVIILKNPTHNQIKADAMVTQEKGVALGILTADCQPILFAEPYSNVIGAAHAGWKGALSGVVENTIEAMVSLGAKRNRIKAIIGPTISHNAYEVGGEFFDRFILDATENSKFFKSTTGNKMLFDLPAYTLKRLKDAGVTGEWVKECTYENSRRFYSYRRSVHNGHADYGRLMSIIAI